MECYVGINVSLELSNLCVLDVTRKVIREAKVASEPEALVAFLRGLDLVIGRVGLEASPLSQWLYDGLHEAGLGPWQRSAPNPHTRAVAVWRGRCTARKDAQQTAISR